MMKRYLTFLLPLVLVPATGAGQRFFDDFDGEDLGGHWSDGNPKGGMIYSVHDSLLEVYGFTGFFGVREWITARIHPFDDFDMRARVGWTAEVPREALTVALGGGFPNDAAVALMGFVRETNGGGVRTSRVAALFRDGPRVDIDAPASGFHTFRLTRSAGVFSAYFNDQLILQGTGSDMPADTIVLHFSGSPRQPVDLMVDRVSVVPEPASFLAGAGFLTWLRIRSRRTR
ncbi:MAG: hypothetical protein AB1725_03385 [Armatimonadota bacterium]